MKSVLLFGTNEIAEIISYNVDNNLGIEPMEVIGFVLDDEYFSQDSFAGKQVYRYSEAKNKLFGKVEIIVCIGYKEMNEGRKKVFYRLQKEGWSIGSFVSRESRIYAKGQGVGNIFLNASFVGVDSVIGNGNIFSFGKISHHSRLGNFNYLSNNSVGGHVCIGDCCFLGLQSCIKDNIHIHDKTLVGAGCYLGHSTKLPGQAYGASRAVKLGKSEEVMEFYA